MREDDKWTTEDRHDPTIAQLLEHLQEMRTTVPVNYQLKAELKKRLLEQMKQTQSGAAQQSADSEATASRWKKWHLAAGVAAVAILAAVLFFNRAVFSLDEKLQKTLPPETTVEQVAITSTGEKVAYVTDKTKLQTYLVDDKREENAFTLPSTTGKYDSIAWANHSDRLAVVENTDQYSRLWMIDGKDNGREQSFRLVAERKGVQLSSPQWDPTDRYLTYTRTGNGTSEIWMNSTFSSEEKKIADGSDPVWSPDGKSLAYSHEGNVVVLHMQTGEQQTIGKGKSPSWMRNDSLTYLAASGELYHVTLDEQKEQSSPIRLPVEEGGSAVRAHWIKNGDLLFVIRQKGTAVSYSLLERD